MRWMLEREDVGESVCRGGILGDDMGLGKTFQTIGLLKNGISLRTLILCPPALIAGWTEELKACGYAVAVLLTASWSLPLTTANTVFLTSYSKAVLYKRFLTESAFQRVILDEGHVIRNGKNTARWVACMAIAKNAVCRWILSATPVQNGYSDWRNLCSWLLVQRVTDRLLCDQRRRGPPYPAAAPWPQQHLVAAGAVCPRPMATAMLHTSGGKRSCKRLPALKI